jgi:hypothetical protein
LASILCLLLVSAQAWADSCSQAMPIPDHAKAGEKFSVSYGIGYWWYVDIYWDDGPLQVYSFTNVDGLVTVTFDVPLDARPGPHEVKTVFVDSSIGSDQCFATFVVDDSTVNQDAYPPAINPQRNSLPDTGLKNLTSALYLLLAAGGIVLIKRKSFRRASKS